MISSRNRPRHDVGVLSNSVDWWMKTTSPLRMFEPRIPREEWLRETFGVDPAILAADVGQSEATIRVRQRKVGLRPCASSRDKQIRPRPPL